MLDITRRSLLPLLAVALSAASAAGQGFTAGELWQLSADNSVVQSFGPALHTSHSFSAQSISSPRSMAFSPDGRLFILGDSPPRVASFNSEVQSPGQSFDLDPAAQPQALAFGPDGVLWVLDDATDSLLRFTVQGTPRSAVPLPASDYGGVTTIAFGADGHLFVPDPGTDSVLEVDADSGVVVRSLGGDVLADPKGVALGADGRIMVVDIAAVWRFDAHGTVVDSLTDVASGISFDGPLAFAPSGRLIVTDAPAGKIYALKDDLGIGDQASLPAGPTVSLACAPWRFTAKVKGHVVVAGQPLSKIKELSAVLSVLPGSGTLMLALTDDVAQDLDFATVFGTNFLVARGFEAAQDDTSKQRLFQGVQVGAPAADNGTGSLLLTVSGHMKAGQFVPKSASGTLSRASGAGAYWATITTGKSLN